MAGQTKNKLTLFLMELLMVILFFSVCAAICVGVFGGAQKLAVQSNDRNHAVTELRNTANCYKAAEGDLQQTAEWMECTLLDDGVEKYYDKNWIPCKEEDSVYKLILMQKERFGEAWICVAKEDDTICELNVKTHSGRTQ